MGSHDLGEAGTTINQKAKACLDEANYDSPISQPGLVLNEECNAILTREEVS